MGRPPLVALFFRADGYQVSWAPLDTMGLVARSAWYPASNPVAVARTNSVACERPGERDGWLASAGAELVVDLAVQYDVPYRVRIGAAAPYAAPRAISRGGAFYLTLGGYF